MGSRVVAWAWAWGTILLGGTRTHVGAACILPSMSIETTNGLSISGCYRETVYLGLYQTIVWTIEGQDIADTGTAAIVADLVSATPWCSVRVLLFCRAAASLVCCASAALPWCSKPCIPVYYYNSPLNPISTRLVLNSFILHFALLCNICSSCGITNPSSKPYVF